MSDKNLPSPTKSPRQTPDKPHTIPIQAPKPIPRPKPLQGETVYKTHDPDTKKVPNR
jgi:hypothetical protein